MALITLIIVTHNSREWLRPFAESWNAALANCPEISPELVNVVVSDTGSTDDSRELAAALFPSAKVLQLENIGYGAAINRAVATGVSSYLLLCNPDLTFSTDFVRAFLKPVLLPAMESKDWAQERVFAPRLLNPDGTNQASIGKFPTILSLIRDQFRPRELRKYFFPQPRQPGPVEWASGACLLLFSNLFHIVRGFDEKFFLYVEEVDFQRRLLRTGHATFFVPQATVIHHQPNALRPSQTKVDRYAARGMLRYFAKHAGASLLGYRLLAFLAGRLAMEEASASRRAILARSTGP